MPSSQFFCRNVHITKLLRRFPKGQRLVEMLNDEVASEDFSAIQRALVATHRYNTDLSSSNEHEVLLYSEEAAAQN